MRDRLTSDDVTRVHQPSHSLRGDQSESSQFFIHADQVPSSRSRTHTRRERTARACGHSRSCRDGDLSEMILKAIQTRLESSPWVPSSPHAGKLDHGEELDRPALATAGQEVHGARLTASEVQLSTMHSPLTVGTPS